MANKKQRSRICAQRRRRQQKGCGGWPVMPVIKGVYGTLKLAADVAKANPNSIGAKAADMRFGSTWRNRGVRVKERATLQRFQEIGTRKLRHDMIFFVYFL